MKQLTPLRQLYLKKRVSASQNTIPDSIDALKVLYTRGMQLVWADEGDIGPAEVFESLGTDGAALFMNGMKLLQFILNEDPDWDFPKPTHEYTLNEDGTVTVGDPLE